jgi:hypothetical protein
MKGLGGRTRGENALLDKRTKTCIASAICAVTRATAPNAYCLKAASASLAARYMALQSRWPRACLPAEYALAALRLLRSAHDREAMDFALRVNARESRRKALLEYGWGGGLISTEAERQRYWQEQAQFSTLRSFLGGSSILDFDAADSVLEAGCSAGGNILALKQHAAGIRADGFDFRQDAVALANDVVGDERSRFFVGDLTDPAFLEGLQSASYDWVLMLSVLSHLSRESVEHTRQLRRKAVEELYRVCRKGLFLVDGRIPEQARVKLGLNNIHEEDITCHLAPLGGEVYVLPGRVEGLPDLWGYLVRKQPLTPRCVPSAGN